MDLIPAIDLLDGRVVRLLKGNFADCKVYAHSARALADQYADAGAEWLHVVDLAASRDGQQADTTALFALLRSARQSVQTGGGVRDSGDIHRRLSGGAARVVIGSVCVTEPARFGRWLNAFGPQQLVAALDVQIDATGIPWPRIHGWTDSGKQTLWALLEQFTGDGLQHLLCTDIHRDGVLDGPNTALYEEILRRFPGINLQASGGVSSVADLVALKRVGARGAITGKALLENRFSVEQALLAIE